MKIHLYPLKKKSLVWGTPWLQTCVTKIWDRVVYTIFPPTKVLEHSQKVSVYTQLLNLELNQFSEIYYYTLRFRFHKHFRPKFWFHYRVSFTVERNIKK